MRSANVHVLRKRRGKELGDPLAQAAPTVRCLYGPVDDRPGADAKMLALVISRGIRRALPRLAYASAIRAEATTFNNNHFPALPMSPMEATVDPSSPGSRLDAG